MPASTRTSLLVRAAICVLVASLVGTLAPMSPASAQSLGEIRGRLDQARDERARLEDRMQHAQERLEELHARTVELEDEQARLLRELDRYDAEIQRLTAQVAQRVRENFKHGSSLDPVAVFLASDDPSGALARAETVRWLVAGDTTRVDELAAARIQAGVTRALLDERSRELEAAAAEFAELADELQDDLAAVSALEASLTDQERAELARLERERLERERREREQREAEAAARAAEQEVQDDGEPEPTAGSGALVCPLDRPHSFIDSWGHPRSGGRRHRGTDMMAPHGIAVRAITDGVWVHRRPGPSAGIWGVLRGSNGDHYWYMHLASHTVSDGTRVTAGQQIGTNGSTGNATTPHLHFELHPGGGSAVNPYSLLRRVC